MVTELLDKIVQNICKQTEGDNESICTRNTTETSDTHDVFQLNSNNVDSALLSQRYKNKHLIV